MFAEDFQNLQKVPSLTEEKLPPVKEAVVVEKKRKIRILPRPNQSVAGDGGVKTSSVVYAGKRYDIPEGYRLSISRKKKPLVDGAVEEFVQTVRGLGYKVPQHTKLVAVRKKRPSSTSVKKTSTTTLTE